MVSPFGYTGASRPGLFNQQQQPNNFSGWDDRLNKIEQGIAGLTKQFSNFQGPGDVAPEYTGNAAPEPLEQTMNAPEPLELDSTAPPPIGGQNDPSWHGGSGGGQALSQSRYNPYSQNFNPLTAEQFASQQDLWGRRQDYNKFAGMAGDVTGTGMSPLSRVYGSDPRFGHAYEDWQGADQSLGMENWMQDYNFDLAPDRPQFQLGQGFGQGPRGFQSIMADYQQAQLDYTNSPEYQAWKQREEARGPLSAATTQTIGGWQNYHGRPDIDPYFSMGMGGENPSYEDYLSSRENSRENMRRMREMQISQSPTTSPIRGITAIQQFQRTIPGAGTSAPATSSLQGPVQNQIQQGLGSLPQGAGI